MILEDPMAHCIEKSLSDLCVKVAGVAGGCVKSEEFYDYAKNPLSDWHCKVFNIVIPKDCVESKVTQICDDIKQGGAPKNLLLCGDIITEELTDCLTKNSFNMFYEQTGMYIDLESFSAEEDDLTKSAKIINNEKDIEQWTSTYNAAFKKQYGPALFKLLLKENDIKLYTYIHENKMAATALMFLHDGVAGLHMIGTVDDVRGQGIGTAITRKMLIDAKLAGYKTCALQASPMGRPVYQKMGFNPVCRVCHWEYKPTI